MGSVSRSHRRARSSKVSYVDSCSEEEDEDFSVASDDVVSKSAENKVFTRRNLALKKVSRFQARTEALQIEQAIEESHPQGKVKQDAGPLPVKAATYTKEVDDSEEDGPTVPPCITNGAAVSTHSDQEVVKCIPTEDDVQHQGIRMQVPLTTLKEDPELRDVDIHSPKGPELLDANPKLSKAARKKEDLDWSSNDDDNYDDDDMSMTEDESSDASEDLKLKRKGPVKAQPRCKKAPGNTGKELKPLTAPVKKPRSTRSVSEVGARLNTKKSLPPKGIGIKPLLHAKLADSNVEACEVSSFDTPKKHFMISKDCKELGGKGLLLKGCKSTIVDAQKRHHALHGKATSLDTCETPGILASSAQSPTGLHRRVIGLSRRFKPPPLHPYLTRMEG